MNVTPGKLITVEGMDCSGKTSVIVPAIQKWFDDHQIPAQSVADMNTTPYSKAIRSIFLGETARETEITTLIMLSCSARRELIQSCIRPILEKGINVICDRFVATTYVYGNKAKHLRQLLDISIDGLYPDITFMCTLDWDDFIKRQDARAITKDRFEDRDHDLFEDRKLKYHEYFELTAKHTRVTSLNTSDSKVSVLEEIDQTLKHAFIRTRHSA